MVLKLLHHDRVLRPTAQGKAITDLIFVLGKFGLMVSSDYLQFIFASHDVFSDRLSPLILTLIQKEQGFLSLVYKWGN